MKDKGNKPITVTAVNIILFSAGATCIVIGCINLIKGNAALATLGLGAGLLLLFSATIDRFESVKGLGLEAKTRELKETIGEAKHAVDELKQLAEISGRTLSLLAAKVGRWDSAFTFDESYELASQVRNNLQSLNCENLAIKEALSPWVKVTLNDLARNFIQNINIATNTQLQILHSQRANIPSPLDANDPVLAELTTRINRISEHTEAGMELPKWGNSELLSKLEAHIVSAPEIPQLVKDENLCNLRSWESEINYLMKHSNVNNRLRWAEALKRS